MWLGCGSGVGLVLPSDSGVSLRMQRCAKTLAAAAVLDGPISCKLLVAGE